MSAQAPPLAERLRPGSLNDVIGQEHLLAEGQPLAQMIANKRLESLIFWGPPGSGKTTLARLMAEPCAMEFMAVSSVTSGVADLRKVFAHAEHRRTQGGGVCLFVDEIHRFNRAQQDIFLPWIEDGRLVLIGATTENPSFELNAALLSRMRVLVLQRLSDAALAQVLERCERQLGRPLPLSATAREHLIAMADGDARYLLNMTESLLAFTPDNTTPHIKANMLTKLLQRRAPGYDKNREAHYNLISTLHKALRGSDPDAGLYWLARMLDGGEDPHYIARRLLRFAWEDSGLADPNGPRIVLAAWETFQRLGAPEGELALAGAVVYLALAPRSNALYRAWGTARDAARKHGSLPPPMHSVNAPTRLMKSLGYGAGYHYDHDAANAFSAQNHFPPDMPRQQFYHPKDQGMERKLAERLEYFNTLRQQKKPPGRTTEHTTS